MISKKPISIRSSIYHPSEPVTWVGQGRRREEICVGFESGKLQLFDSRFKPTSDPSPVFGRGEAINGAAFLDDLCAVSSCGEVSLTACSINLRQRSYVRALGNGTERHTFLR